MAHSASQDAAVLYQASEYLDRSFEGSGIGCWRAIYLEFLPALSASCVIEFGAGTPDFLCQVRATRRVAVDTGHRFAPEFRAHRISFACRDLEQDRLSDLGPADVGVCSDVFEHLINPASALEHISDTLTPEGVLFSHVPNEFRPRHTLRVMMGRSESVLFHEGHAEWENPHFRRFTDKGFRAFLARRFRHNLPLTDLRSGRAARWLRRAGLGVPYCLQEGPTYASTNSAAVYERLVLAKREISRPE